MILIFGALLGFVSVAFGAYAEHGLKQHVTDEHFRFLMTAIRYNQVNAVIISAIGLVFLSNHSSFANKALSLSGFLFIIGTVLFSFSIYTSVAFEIPALVKITPIGGMTIMSAWLLLMIAGITGRKKA